MESDVEKIKQRLPIADVVGGYVKLSRAGKNLSARCPFHKEKTPSFNVSPERNAYYCFGCGEKGDIFTFVEKMEGVDFRGALTILAERAGVQLSKHQGQSGPSKDVKERLYALHEDATQLFEKTLARRLDVQDYLKKRGLTKETITKWRLGYAENQWRTLTDRMRELKYSDEELLTSGLAIRPEKSGTDLYDRFRGRIMFPLFDQGGRCIAFSGRFFEAMKEGSQEKEPAKYVNSPETPLFHKSNVLYGLDKARGPMRKSDFAILVEGQMDLLMMHQCGFPNTVAGSGTALTPEHLKAISHITKRLVLALDSDPAGVRSALRSAHMAFTQGFDLRIAGFPEGSDPADVGRDDEEALKRAVRNSQTAVEFFLHYLRGRAKDERAFRKLAEEQVIPLIASMQSKIEQAHFIQVTARMLSIPEESIKEEVVKRTPSLSGTPSAERTDAAMKPREALAGKLDTTAALILLHADSKEKERLEELLPSQRMTQVTTFLAEEKDRLLFLSESIDTLDMQELFAIVQTELLKEEIEHVRRQEREAAAQGNTGQMSELASRLKDLTRKLHGM